MLLGEFKGSKQTPLKEPELGRGGDILGPQKGQWDKDEDGDSYWKVQKGEASALSSVGLRGVSGRQSPGE